MAKKAMRSTLADGAFTEGGLSRRDVLLASLALPALGGAVGAASLLVPGLAKAAAAGQCVVGVTQEAVNFNPLLYVNTGVETSVEFIVFDSLWRIDPQGKFVPNLATEIPTRRERRRLEGRPHLDDQAAPRRRLARRPAVHRGRRRLHARRHHESESRGAQPQRPRACRALRGVKDEHTVKIKLKDSFAPYIVSWQKTSIIPKHILATVPDINTAPFNTSRRSARGRSSSRNRVAGSYIEFEPNPEISWRRAEADLAHPEIRARPADAVRAVPDRRGRRLRQPGHPAAALPAREGAAADQRSSSTPNPFVEFIYFNCGKPQFDGQAGAPGALHGGGPQGLDRRGLLRRARPDAELSAAEPLGL